MKKNKDSVLILPGCTIKYSRSPDYFVFTNERQKIGYDVVFEFPWKKKDIFEEAYKILSKRHCSDDLELCKKMFNILSLTKHVYPVVIYESNSKI